MARQTRQEIIARFRADMARLLAATDSIAEDQRGHIVYDDWTIKELLAHIAAWDRELVRGLDQLLAGQRPAFASYEEAEFNARAVEASRPLPFAEVLAGAREAHETLVSRIEALTDEKWMRSAPHRWGGRAPITVASLFYYRYKGETHYGGHATEIESWAARSGYVQP